MTKNKKTPAAEKNTAVAAATIAAKPAPRASFNYAASKDGVSPASPESLRGMAIALLTGGATLDQVVDATDAWYAARGRYPKTTVYSRAVELVRLVAKKNGYGLATDTKTGVIRITG